MLKNFFKLALLLVIILGVSLPCYADTKTWEVLKGAYKLGQGFLQNNPTIQAQGSFSYVPQGKSNSGQYYSPKVSSSYSPNYSSNYQQSNGYTPQYYQSQGSQYYPMGSGNVQQASNEYSYPKFNLEPKANTIKTTGQIFLTNAKKEDVITLLTEIQRNKSWRFGEYPKYGSFYTNSSGYDASKIDLYYLTFENDRVFLITINQMSNGTVITAHSSAFLVKDQLGELVAYFNKYYSVQTSQFE